MKPGLPWANKEKQELSSYGSSSMLQQNDVIRGLAVGPETFQNQWCDGQDHCNYHRLFQSVSFAGLCLSGP